MSIHKDEIGAYAHSWRKIIYRKICKKNGYWQAQIWFISGHRVVIGGRDWEETLSLADLVSRGFLNNAIAAARKSGVFYP